MYKMDIKLDLCIYNTQGYAFENWVEGLSHEAYYPWESPPKNWVKSANPTIATKEKTVSIQL